MNNTAREKDRVDHSVRSDIISNQAIFLSNNELPQSHSQIQNVSGINENNRYTGLRQRSNSLGGIGVYPQSASETQHQR
jgi:hypothetical protein